MPGSTAGQIAAALASPPASQTLASLLGFRMSFLCKSCAAIAVLNFI